MSLTNPNKVITEERLSEFYGQILPYLGGMPEALANKFDKANLYSETEKIVGCWIDGKPIYQKTVTGTSGAANTDASLGAIADVDCAISIYGVCVADTIQQSVPNAGLYAKFQNGAVMVYPTNTGYANKVCRVTIQYTKTTDQPNSFNIGSDTDYSTDEKIIGTWIDGKPLYQKSYEVTTPNTTAHTTIITLDASIEVKCIDGFIDDICVPVNKFASNSFSIYTYCDSSSYAIKQAVVGWTNRSEIVTLLYTKTTD